MYLLSSVRLPPARKAPWYKKISKIYDLFYPSSKKALNLTSTLLFSISSCRWKQFHESKFRITLIKDIINLVLVNYGVLCRIDETNSNVESKADRLEKNKKKTSCGNENFAIYYVLVWQATSQNYSQRFKLGVSQKYFHFNVRTAIILSSSRVANISIIQSLTKHEQFSSLNGLNAKSKLLKYFQTYIQHRGCPAMGI